ncbi:hypothetical protein DICPUDRAFT_84992 [Dictyostelium purpureum]|uniref:Lipid-binding serum glycoprotein C-terminal domain-containing protein n=1 Tax=Dictyostelium purpureum TaxID=5786 RepID=F1A4C7_DICPU|nr:uncharacterized protein DICPUDRAFT_84992 [Dictyostelium purpureum]EGC28950.1 hypothetical protein DICPUDRAFT_84992 [Dictyostelium purpureum]|eukprot:XP_003294520.1 hypothetical protein DICPUDRAFT_84992 [Dictyostelium purpureum]
MIKLFVSLLLLSICINSSYGFSYPEEGAYVGINSNFISILTNEFTSLFQNQINSFQVPDISGSVGSDKYDFSSISQSVQLSGFYYTQTGSGQYQIGFQSITFSIHTDFKACVHKMVDGKQIDLCEHGNVKINSQATISSTSNVNVVFDTSSPSLTCLSTTINVPSNGINYEVDCTSRICDKTHDIRDKIEQDFIPQVQTSVTTAINGMISKYETFFTTLKPLNILFKGNELFVNSEGYLIQSNISSASLTPTLLYAINGGVVVKNSNGQYIYPSQSPNTLPSYIAVEQFSSDVSVVLTPFFFESLVDAGLDIMLPFEITEEMVPPSSPIHLNTSDPFFNQTAPGLTAKYPNSLISVSLNSPAPPTVSLNQTGIFIRTAISADFYVESLNTKEFSVVFSFGIELTPTLKQVSNGFNISATLDTIDVYSALVSFSSVGDVDTTGFIQLIQLIQGFIQVPMVTIQNPLTTFSITSLSFSDNNQYIQILLNLSKDMLSQIKIN